MHKSYSLTSCQVSIQSIISILILFSAPMAAAVVYDIGPGRPYTSLGAFPFEQLQAGDIVNIHYRPEPYREKVRIRAQGTPSSPVIIRGISGPGGERPILDGINATTRTTDTYGYPPLQDLGLVIIFRSDADPFEYKPKHILLEGLEIRNADAGNGNTFSDAAGLTRSWAENACGIWALGVENLTIRDCAIHTCGNGLFIASKGEEETQSRNILVERCAIYGNSVPGSFFEHNIYTEALNTTFQYNYLGPIREGAQGGNLKDRSARAIIRYNWIQGGQRLIDLVEAQDSYPIVGGLPEYGDDYVYGNVLITNPGDAGALVHYGGDSGLDQTYRKGTLHFYHNTVRILRDQSELYRTHLFDITSNEQTVDARNNIVYVAPFTLGEAPTNLQLSINAGIINLGINWISPGWQPWTDNGTQIVGTITGSSNVIGAADNLPGFANLATNDLSLLQSSPCIDISQPLDAASVASFPVTMQYSSPRSALPRTSVGVAPDLGAFEFGVLGEGEEGAQEGLLEGASEGVEEGIIEGEGLTEGEGEGISPVHSADIDANRQINLSELLRVVQLYNARAYSYCPLEGTEDGYCPGS